MADTVAHPVTACRNNNYLAVSPTAFWISWIMYNSVGLLLHKIYMYMTVECHALPATIVGSCSDSATDSAVETIKVSASASACLVLIPAVYIFFTQRIYQP